MTSRRSPNLRRINLLIGAILVIAGITGGFILTFWLLVILLPITGVASSWIMAWTTVRGREGHTVLALLLTILFVWWFACFLQDGAEIRTWYGIFLIGSLLIVQATFFLSAKRRALNPIDVRTGTDRLDQPQTEI